MLEALKDGPMTASEVSERTGVATGSASTLLSKLSKSSEVVKAERGYRVPDGAKRVGRLRHHWRRSDRR